MLVLTGDEVAALLDLDELIDALAPAMADLSAGRASVPDRVAAVVPAVDGRLLAMPGHVPSQGALVTKLVSVFPGNAGTPVPTHQAVVAVFDPATGTPVALLDGTVLTAVRTGAGSALSVRLLARPGASVLALLGTGVQARSHARAVARVAPVEEVRVHGRDRARAEALAAELGEELGVAVRAVGSSREAVAGADVVCATTHPTEPVVRRDELPPGVHVTSVGWAPGGREVDDATVAGALVCVESRRTAFAPVTAAGSTDLTEPLARGVLAEEDVVEVGELVTGARPGRTSADQVTLYKSVGVAVQDATAATLVLAAAQRAGTGRELAF
ncbi:ornithine cyclodeaminase [Geodermatophilus telluris]|uniref:Ornithine cyclodeaminase n=1 Tax=Geodermatophilus telluris TaxID=1190417 RepID=A0A1G6QYK3_9ACTN|nr:ornithine cyclodeaminase family protein [Geodermatophilus telluris]SDC97273.1 ornithine cyclodeaminase [Geodermatophilus telluris]